MVFARLSHRLTDELRVLLDYGLDDETRPPRVSRLMERLHVSRRSFAARVKSVGAASPHTLLNWCLVLRAVNLLEHTRHPVEEVGRRLGLSGAHVFRELLKRYLGRTPRHLQDPKDWRTVVDAFIGFVGRGPTAPG
ncbi:MAG: AraC family transcriptional regulator [Gemmatimonadota bacterium]